MLSVNWCRLSMWMPRISPAESGCSTSISSTMGWGTSLWMNWKQKKRRDRSHAKSSPFRELLQILFYGNSALGNSLPYLSCVDFSGCVRQGAPFFLRCFLQFTNLQISDSIYATELSFTRKRFTTQQIRRMGFLIEKNKAFNRIFR